MGARPGLMQLTTVYDYRFRFRRRTEVIFVRFGDALLSRPSYKAGLTKKHRRCERRAQIAG